MSKNETIVCDVCESEAVTVREDTVDLCSKCYTMLSVISAEDIAPLEVAHDTR
jgi:hypothetical protein